MTHALTRRRGDARDVSDDRLCNEPVNETRGRFLVAAADLADEDDSLGPRITLEQLQHVDEIHAAHGVAADANASALPQADVGSLEHGFICQRPGTGHDAYRTFLVNE